MKLLNRLFIALTVAGLATMLVSVSARAGGLAFDAADNLFAADKHSVCKYTPDGTKSTFATGLKEPLGLCFDRKGNFFVLDGLAPTSSILKFTPDGKRTTFATRISFVAMAVDSSNNLFVSQGGSIYKFTPEGAKSTFVSGLGNAIDLAFDGAGNLFVVDQAMKDRVGRSIVKIKSDGTNSTFATGLKDPSSLAVDAAGNVYVAVVPADDASSRAILKFSPDGIQSTFTSALGAYATLGLAFERAGNVFALNDHGILKFDSSGTPTTFASDWISPDKHWEYKCAEYGLGQCAPEIVKTGTTQVVLDLDQELQVYDPEARQADVIWGPDSKRFGFNYSPPHAHHTSYETVAFYQLQGDKWVALHSPADEASQRAQLVQLAKDHLPKSFNPRHCAPEEDILKLRNWTDANTATLYAPCYGRTSGQLEAAFLFTLKFDDAGNWKIVKTHQISEKEVKKFND
jgi:hypothetical protein